jgi:hypothetical protein
MRRFMAGVSAVAFMIPIMNYARANTYDFIITNYTPGPYNNKNDVFAGMDFLDIASSQVAQGSLHATVTCPAGGYAVRVGCSAPWPSSMLSGRIGLGGEIPGPTWQGASSIFDLVFNSDGTLSGSLESTLDTIEDDTLDVSGSGMDWSGFVNSEECNCGGQVEGYWSDPGGSANVPEPQSIVMLLTALAGFWFTRKMIRL